MKYHRRKTLLSLLLVLPAFVLTASGQTLQARLDRQTDFAPNAGSPIEQLIEVAKRFKIPIGIEWLGRDDIRQPELNSQSIEQERRPSDSPTPTSNTQSVLELIRSIAHQSPDLEVLVEDKLVHVFSKSSVVHPFNFLNLRINHFEVRDESLYGAQYRLSLAINMTLHPERYKNGYAGGYGGVSAYDPSGLFYIKNITFSADDLTVRDILNKIAIENGNSLWLVRLRPEEFAGDKPDWKAKPLDQSRHSPQSAYSPLSGRWQFIPLAGLSQLAKEQVNVELTIDGFFTAKQFAFPVMMEHRLGGAPGNGNGISSSDGSRCTYSVGVSGVQNDRVAIHVSVTVTPKGKPECVFNRIIEVVRGQIVEQEFGDIIRISALIEARAVSK